LKKPSHSLGSPAMVLAAQHDRLFPSLNVSAHVPRDFSNIDGAEVILSSSQFIPERCFLAVNERTDSFWSG
jgi:hypothetical protein